VPAAPELGDRFCEIGPIEIFHQIVSQNPRGADGDIGIAGKIAINLKGKQVGGKQQGQA